MFINGKTQIRTRFAVAPTEHFHIGSARIALFNWLYARRHGGSLTLRIDDMDGGCRIVPKYIKNIEPILNGLKWLGIDWDNGPIYQSERRKHYADVAEALIKLGLAYPDPIDPDYQDVYRGFNRELPSAQAFELYDDDAGWNVRFKIPEDSDIILDGGQLFWDTNHIGDPIILYANGNASCDFATAVDDGEMKITNVIRTEELNNTPVQLLIMQALGHVPPYYAHVPLILAGKEKLTKRDMVKFVTPEIRKKLLAIGFDNYEIDVRGELNPAAITYYQVLGYKPEALVNYLTVADETKRIDLDTLKREFSLERVCSIAMSHDLRKLNWLSSEYAYFDSSEVKILECIKFLTEAKLIPTTPAPECVTKVQQVVDICADHIKIYSDILTYAFFFRKPVYEQQCLDKYLDTDMCDLMDVITQLFKYLPKWQSRDLECEVKVFMSLRERKPIKMVSALRVAITGAMHELNLYDAMELLGKDECVERCLTAMTSVHHQRYVYEE